MRDDEYFVIKDRAAAVLLKILDVTGVGMGGRERNGRPTGEIVIKVFVRRKKPAGDVRPEEMIPTSFEGVPTDVVEMGPIVPSAEPGAPSPVTEDSEVVLTDPLRGGMCLATELGGGSAGTLGCFLRDKDDASAIYALTNNHIVAKGRFSLSRRVLQPNASGTFDLLGYPAAGDAELDAALVRLEPDLQWLPAIKEIGFVKGTHDVTIAEAATQTYEVKKRGIRTRLTGGVVVGVGVQFSARKKKIYTLIRPNPAAPPHPPTQQVHFAFFGDSGSAVVNADNEVVALLWGSEDPNVVTRQFLEGAATPIQRVLERFRKVDKIDLEVATPIDPNPTDAGEVRRVLVAAGAPLIAAGEVATKADQRHDRPLSGGTQVTAEPFLGVLASGTLGCVVTEVADPDTGYVLTSYAGLSANGTRPPTTDTDVGQPDNDDSCSLCCSNTVGEFFKGGPDATTPTAALVKLKDDQRWLAEIMQIGLIDDIETLSAADVDSGAYQVRKRGIGTRLTGGVVTAVGGVGGTLPSGVRPDAMVIRPNPNPFKPGQSICFSHFIDRGALVVNKFNKVVGLLYDEVPIPDNGVDIVHGVATPIQIVLDALNNLADFEIKVATATAPDQVQTTSNRVATRHDASLPPVVAAPRPRRDPLPAFPLEAAAVAGALAGLREELSLSIAGRLAIATWTEHRREIRHLIDHNRKVATVWHRSGGPALLQSLLRVLHTPSATMPATVNGRPIAACLDRLCVVFGKYGSAALQADATRLRPQLPSIGGLSFAEMIAALENWSRAPGLR